MAEINGWSVPKDENGKAYYSYRKVTYWVNSTENFKYIIKGDLNYRPDIIEDRPVPVASEFTDWKTGIKYIMRNDGWAILPGGGGGGGGDITRDEVIAMDAAVLEEAKGYSDSKHVLVEVAENQTINGYEVPKLTKEDLLKAYNGIVAGNSVTVVDATGNYSFAVKQADTDTEDFYICFDYCSIMILTYQLHDEDVTTDYKEIGSGSGPAKFLKEISTEIQAAGLEVTINDQDNTPTKFLVPNYGGGEGWKYLDQFNKIEDYLYQAKLKTHDYVFANNYFKRADAEVPVASCTTLAKDGIFARNYDWAFDNSVEFLYNVDFVANVRRSSISMVGGAKMFSKAYIEGGVFNDNIKLIPFFTTDGINDAGVKVSTHVINNDGYGTDDGVINPTGDVEQEMASLMIPRYILDTFTSATAAVNYITQHVKVYHPAKLLALGYLQTFTIADDEHTYILEPWNHEFKLVTDKTAIVTNFEWWHTTPTDGILWTNADIPEGKEPGSQTNSQHGAMGVERYNLAFRSIEDTTLDSSSAKTTLKKLNYTRLYDSHPNPPEKAWLSDYISKDDGLTADGSLPEAFDDIRDAAADAYTNRDRESAETWQTVHSAIYDWENKKLYLSVQEQDEWYEFDIPWFPGELATVEYVNEKSELAYNNSKTYTNEECAKRSPIIDAGDNITAEIVEETGHVRISSTASGGDITRNEVVEMIREALETAQGYANTAETNANHYTNEELNKVARRVQDLEEWVEDTGTAELDYVLDDDSTVSITHRIEKPSE